MIYSIHAWRLEEDGECFRNFPADCRNPTLAIQCCSDLLTDNPSFTLVMLRMWYQVLRFDHELGAAQFIRIPGHKEVTVRIDRLVNLLERGTENRVYRPDVFIRDRKPVKVQLEFSSTEDVLLNSDKLLPYLLDEPPSIIVPVSPILMI